MAGGAQTVEVEDPFGDGRRTAVGTVRGGQVFAPLMEELANKKKAAAEGAGAATAAAEEGKSATEETDEEKAAEGEKPPRPKARMPEREIRRILSWKPKPIPRRYADLKQGNPDLVPLPSEEMDNEKENLYFLAKAFYCMEERYPKLQEWVRQELATKGYVEMDDDWVKRRAEAEEAVEEGWKGIEKRIKELQFSEDEIDYDDDIDSDDDDSDEEEEEVIANDPDEHDDDEEVVANDRDEDEEEQEEEQ